MIHDVKKALLKEIYKRTNIKINMTNVEQGAKFPCFFCHFITNKIKTVATIDYLNIIDFDLIYYPSENKENLKEMEDIVFELNKIKSFEYNDKNIIIENSNVEIVDNVLHYIIRVYIEMEAKKEIVPELESMKLLKTKLEELSNKKTFYINGDLKEVRNGFFIIEPSTTETLNNSINGFKDYEREIVIRYVDSDSGIDIYGYLENLMDKILIAIKGKNGIYKINYNIDLSYDKEEYEELNIINHELTLLLTERKK